MRKFAGIVLSLAVLVGVLSAGAGGTAVAAGEERFVYVGGAPIGIALNADGLIVTGVGDVVTEEGSARPLEGSGLRPGDVVKKLDGEEADNLFEFRKKVSEAAGEVVLSVERDSRTFDVKATPVSEAASGKKRLGICLKEDVGGIGTLTFVTEQGAYAALGHHVADPETGVCAELQEGKVFDVAIDGVVKGEPGRAGGLGAELNRLAPPVGRNTENTEIGIYGVWNSRPRGERVRVAERGEAHPGHAQVLTTIEGREPVLYDVDIVKCEPQSERAQKGLVIAVRDRRLLDKAGGIVQGMSGSPILQDGALVGAVTHVFVSDPTRGYGVHARFMLDEAEKVPVPVPYRKAA